VSSYSQAVFQANYYPDYYIFIDPTDRNKIKAKNVRTRRIQFTHRSHADVVLQACCDALSAGGTVYIGPGTFNTFANVSTPNSVNIIGDRRGKTILKRNLTVDNPQVSLTGTNITIKSLTIDGNYPTNTTSLNGGEIHLIGTNILCNDVEVKNFGEDGIVNFGKSRISECVLTGAPQAATDVNISRFGVLAYPNTAAPMTWIERCRIEYCSLNAIFGSGTTIMKDCYFANNASARGGQIGCASDAEMTKVQNCVFERVIGLLQVITYTMLLSLE
jgi:hypothetical protein